jgi:predicted nucleotidyltransferase
MAPQLSADQIEQYRRAARIRWQAEQRQLVRRRERAWAAARQAAVLLKQTFGVRRVLLYGSLIQPDRFTRWSDVDLLAWGLTTENWLRAIAAIRDLSDDIELHLADAACCSPQLLRAAERDGVLL